MGVPGNRLNAAAHCIANNWGAGTTLISSEWKTPRRISGPVRKEDIHVCLMVLRSNGTCLRHCYLMSLPLDISALVEEKP